MFSIITINYNNDKGLKNTFNSFFKQTINKELYEYIVVDGGSTDGSLCLIEEYSESIEKKLIEKDDGIFDAMNKGLSLAEREYVFFLNSGDIFDNDNVLKDIYEKIKEHPEELIYKGGVNTFYEGEFLRAAELAPWVCHQGVFLKTDVAKKYMFDSTLAIFGDLDLWYRLNNDNLYKPYEIDVLICNMEMDGVGNNPEFYQQRLKDKKAFNHKHKLTSRSYLDTSVQYLGYGFFLLFGVRFYHKYFVGCLCNVRKKISRTSN